MTLFQNLSTAHTECLTPDDLVAELQAAGVEYVLLAGYLRLIPPQLCRAYEDKMLNVHPALLPAFGGKGMHGHHVHEAVVASGARFSGPTVHFVNEEFEIWYGDPDKDHGRACFFPIRLGYASTI